MSTFYLLPPRSVVGASFANFLQALFPGLNWNSPELFTLSDVLGEVAEGQPDVFVVHREDLPSDEPLALSLMHDLGAEPGDEVVEVRSGPRPGDWVTQRWQLSPLVTCEE